MLNTADVSHPSNGRHWPQVARHRHELRQASVAPHREADRLETTLQQLELILSTLAEGVCGIDANGAITFANPSAARLLGYGIDDMVGRQADVVLERTRDNRMLRRADGTWMPVEFAITPLQRQGIVAGSVATFLDATERHTSEVERAQRTLESHARQSLEGLN